MSGTHITIDPNVPAGPVARVSDVRANFLATLNRLNRLEDRTTPIVNGGTGANTVAGILYNLGLPSQAACLWQYVYAGTNYFEPAWRSGMEAFLISTAAGTWQSPVTGPSIYLEVAGQPIGNISWALMMAWNQRNTLTSHYNVLAGQGNAIEGKWIQVNEGRQHRFNSSAMMNVFRMTGLTNFNY